MNPEFRESSIKRIIPLESIPGNTHTASHDNGEIDIYKLIHLMEQYPVTEVSIATLAPQLLDKCWRDIQGKDISPQEVIEKYTQASGDSEKLLMMAPEFRTHIEQIHHADLSHPIIINRDNVLDGMHRLAKAVMQNKTTIQAKMIDTIPEEVLVKK